MIETHTAVGCMIKGPFIFNVEGAIFLQFGGKIDRSTLKGAFIGNR